MKIQQPNTIKTNPDETWIEEGLYVRELLNSPACPAFSLARCRLPGRMETRKHRLSVDEWYVIEHGNGQLTLNGNMIEVSDGDSIPICRGTVQSIVNLNDTDLIFQVICMPRFTMAHYEEIDM